MQIMLGPYYSVDIMFNALPSLKVKLNIWRKSTNHCDKIIPLLNVCVLATLVTRISVYSLYFGDEFNIQYYALHLGRV